MMTSSTQSQLIDEGRKTGGYSTTELSMLIGSGLVCVLVGFLIISDFSLIESRMSAKGTPIAEIISITSNVKRRPADLPLWSTATDRQSLYQRDHIFTDDNAAVKIVFQGESEIEIDENSLVVIEQTPDAPMVQIKQGMVVAKTGTGALKSSLVRLKIGDSNAELSGDRITAMVREEKNGLKTVAIVSGSASLVIEGKATTIRANQSVTVDKSTKAIEVFDLPRIELGDSAASVTSHGGVLSLRWSSSVPTDRYRVEIARRASFDTVLSQGDVVNPEFQSTITEPGKYFVRVSVRSNDGWIASLPQVYEFRTDQPLVTLWPGANQQMVADTSTKSASVSFDWQSISTATEYQLQLSLSPSMSPLIEDKRLTKMPTVARPLLIATYWWRVRPIYGEQKGRWSDLQSFAVVQDLRPESDLVEVTQPVSGDFIEVSKASRFVNILWTSYQDSDRYLVEIARDPQFSDMAFAGPIKGTTKRFRPGRDATYYVRVKPVIGSREQSWSTVVSFDVSGVNDSGASRVASPDLPEALTSRAQLKNADVDIRLDRPKLIAPLGAEFQYRKIEPSIAFSWEPVAGAKRYIVDIAYDKAFATKVFSLDVESNSAAQAVKRGRYFWRVHALNSTGRVRTISDTSTFEMKQDVSVPEARMPRDKMLVDFDEDESRNLNFVWDKPKDVGSVIVVLARDRGFTDLVGRLPAQSNSVELNVKSDGLYYWFIEGRDLKENVALRSAISEFSVTTTNVDVQRTFDETIRFEVGYNPSSVKSQQSETGGAASKFNAKFSNAYVLGAKGWLTKNFGIDAELSHVQGALKIQSDWVDSGSYSVDKSFTNFAGVLRYRIGLFQNSYPINVGARLGYQYNHNISLYEIDRQSVGTVDSTFHSVSTGVEATIPFGGSSALESRFDYLHLLSSLPIISSNTRHYVLSTNVVYQFLKHGILGYGIYYKSLSGKYEDLQRSTRGEYDSSQFGMVYSLGWAL